MIKQKKAQLKRKEISWNNKAQLKIKEMMFMLVFVFLFFVIVGLFALSIALKNIKGEATFIAEQQAYAAVFSLAETAEFSCGGSKTNCIDADRLVVFTKPEIANKYRNFWPKFSSIRIIKESGLRKTNGEDIIECNIANYPNCDEFVVLKRNVEERPTLDTFISLCRKDKENNIYYDKCEIAKIELGVEPK